MFCVISWFIPVINVSPFNSILLPACMERVKPKGMLKDQRGNVKQ